MSRSVALGDVCEVIAGQSPPSSTYNVEGRGLPFFQGKADFGNLYPTTRVWCDEPTKIAQPNDILISVRAPVGPTNLCHAEACIGRGLSAIRAKNGTDFKYVLYYLRSIEPQLSIQGRGSTFSAITQSEIRDLKIPYPPLPIQKRIAAILEKADAAREKRRQANQLTEQFLQSAFLEMFGDPVTNPKGWEVKALSELLVFLTSGSRGWAKYYSTKGEVFLRIENVGRNELILENVTLVNPPDTAEAKRIKVKSGDVLLSITADLGRTCVIPENFGPAFINQHLAILRVKDMVPIYLSAFISSEGGASQIRRLDRQGVKSGLNFDDIRSLKVMNPPRSQQLKFTALVEKIESLRAKQRESEKELENLFNSLMQRAFRGELIS